ncbi:hypothetical protein K0M31_002261 [Melipona bicolor]|uniref:Uncharacterized protein n=1 Tax=Melipona bicolor TaxID=60889 RepID=A0AA40GHF7_9HYME|nr:hypothetical protein K0M31_002261 [Melipona bicolor]
MVVEVKGAEKLKLLLICSNVVTLALRVELDPLIEEDITKALEFLLMGDWICRIREKQLNLEDGDEDYRCKNRRTRL